MNVTDYLTMTGAEQEALPKEEQSKVIEAALNAAYAQHSARLSELAAAITPGEAMNMTQAVEIACLQAAIGMMKRMAQATCPTAPLKWLPPAGLQEMQIDQIERIEAKHAAEGDTSPVLATPETEPVTTGGHGGYL